MTLINAPASFPANMWAVVRFLAEAGRPVPTTRARALLCPPSLMGGASDTTFDEALTTLRELRLVEAGPDGVRLGPPLVGLTPDGIEVFLTAVRTALDPAANTGLAIDDAQTGPRDLVRALTWFLSLDPLGPALGWDEVSQRQRGALLPAAGPALVNDARWNRFVYWAPAVGLAASDLVSHGHRSKLVPDCSTAVRQSVQARFADRTPHDLREVIDAVRADLPVLPGGRYSRELGLPTTTDVLDASLSFALLRGHDAAWWRLEHGADSPRTVLLTDPDRPGGVRRVSEITVWGPVDD